MYYCGLQKVTIVDDNDQTASVRFGDDKLMVLVSKSDRTMAVYKPKKGKPIAVDANGLENELIKKLAK